MTTNRQSHIGQKSLHSVSATLSLAIASLFCCVGPTVQAQTFKVINDLAQGGAFPYAGLSMDSAGNLYGTTEGGGGTVFRLVHSGSKWVLTVVHSFKSGTDGAAPNDRVILGPDGSLYGTTTAGGEQRACEGDVNVQGCGTVFRIDKTGMESVLYRFQGGTDGAEPYGDVVFDAAGNIYGTTSEGGAHRCTDIYGNTLGCGIVFELKPAGSSWKESILYRFKGGDDGAAPIAGLVLDRSGNLYGTTSGGGANSDGTVFQLAKSASGWTKKTLFGFDANSSGSSPQAALILDAKGNLYGAATAWGPNGGGTAFELTPSNGHWTFTLIYGFTYNTQGEGGPWRQLVMDSAGSLYGTTEADGPISFGSVFKLTRDADGWTYTSLHDFGDDRGAAGWGPLSNLVFDKHGHLYGTATEGGRSGDGSVYEITP